MTEVRLKATLQRCCHISRLSVSGAQRWWDEAFRKISYRPADLAGNLLLTDMLSKIVARLSLVVSLYEGDRKDGCGGDHRRMIVAALRAKGRMGHHLAGVEGRVRLTEG